MDIQEINNLIDLAVNPYGGAPLIKGPAVNALLKRLAAEIAAASADPAAGADLRAALDTQKTRLDTLVAGAPQALDTLAELAALLAADEQGTAALLATQQQHAQQLANAVHRTGDEDIAGRKQFAEAVWGLAGFVVPAGAGGTTYAGEGHRAINQTYQAYSENGSYVIHSRDGNVVLGRGPAGQPQPTATFTNAGRLGLGTEAPQQQLHLVEGDAEIRLGAGVAQQTPAVVVGTATGKAAGLYAGTTYAGVNFSDDGYFVIAPQPHADFQTNAVAGGASAHSFVVRASGYVGVGTPAPRERLEVAGNVRAAQFVGEGLAMGDGAPVGLDGAYGLFSAAQRNAGVTVNRDNPAAFASFDLLQGGSYQAGWSVQMQPNSPDLVFLNRQAAASQLHLAAASGYVGVGTPAPRERLEVAGNVQAAQFVGDGSRLTGLPQPLLYDGPGAHPDGAMSQQATTAALAVKANLADVAPGPDLKAVRVVKATRQRAFYTGTGTLANPGLDGLKQALAAAQPGDTVQQITDAALQGVGYNGEQVRVPRGVNFNAGGFSLDSRGTGADGLTLVGGAGVVHGHNSTVYTDAPYSWGLGWYNESVDIDYTIYQLHLDVSYRGTGRRAAAAIIALRGKLVHYGNIRAITLTPAIIFGGTGYAYASTDVCSYTHYGSVTVFNQTVAFQVSSIARVLQQGDVVIQDVQSVAGLLQLGGQLEMRSAVLDLRTTDGRGGFWIDPQSVLILTDVTVLGQVPAVPMQAGQAAGATVYLRGDTSLPAGLVWDAALTVVDERTLPPAALAPAVQQLAFTPPALRREVAAGPFAQGERTGAAPAGSRPGMKFSATDDDAAAGYVYEYLPGSADPDGTSYAWVRTLRS